MPCCRYCGWRQKVNYLTETLGFDAGIDYKKEDFAESLAQAVPDGIDVYFENVGGTVGDEVFKHLNRFARVPVCGAISSYNHPEADIGPRIQGTLIKKQVMMRGFLVSEFANAFKEASEQLATWVQEGKIQSQVTIEDGFENAPRAFKIYLRAITLVNKLLKLRNNKVYILQINFVN